MSIWGRRDSEAPAEEAPEGQAGEAHESQAGAQATQEPAAEHQPGEPAPAFWRAQGEPSAPLERDPADAPPPDYEHVPDNPPPAGVPTTMGPTLEYGERVPGEDAAPAAGDTLAGTGEPAPILTGVVIDGEEAREPTVTEPRGEGQEPVMTGAGQPAVAAIAPQRWSEILVSFVDDPRGSVKMAADAVDEAIEEFVNSVRARQRDLAATWQGAEGDTEQLRTALREYRRLGQRVQQLDLGDKAGA